MLDGHVQLAHWHPAALQLHEVHLEEAQVAEDLEVEFVVRFWGEPARPELVEHLSGIADSLLEVVLVHVALHERRLLADLLEVLGLCKRVGGRLAGPQRPGRAPQRYAPACGLAQP